MSVGGVSLLGECHEPGSEGTELMEIIAGARSERGWSGAGAQLEHSRNAVGRSGMDGKKIAGAGAHRQ